MTVAKPVITVDLQGTGRFGNEFFWYIFGKTYARRHGFELQINPWIGNDLFGASDPPIAARLPHVFEPSEHGVDDTVIPHARTPYANVNFVGYFQYHTSYYAPDRDYIRSLFEPRPGLAATLAPAWSQLRARGRTAVGLHIRRSDYGFLYFYRVPIQWYLDCLARLWPELDQPILYIASDDLDEVIGQFAGYAPLSAKDFGAPLQAHDFYRDFYALQHCDILLIPNSTFSFAAAMLNRGLKAAYRSLLPARGFVPFDPWDSKPLQQTWDAYVERQPRFPAIWKPMPAWKRWAKWIRFHYRKIVQNARRSR